MHLDLIACTSTTPTFLVTVILEALNLKCFILKLDDTDGNSFCGGNFHISCTQILALKFWKTICVNCMMKHGIHLSSQLFCFAADGSVSSP